MKKQLLTSLFAFLLVFSLCMGCSKAETGDKTTASDSFEVSSQKTSPVKITLNEVAHSVFYAPLYVAIEKGYFKDENIDLTLVTGFGADKTMTAVISGEADIGFMGSEASVYMYSEGASDYVVNFAQLTQRAGNFLVARQDNEHFQWADLKGKTVLGGRKGGMPEMVFEYILKENGIDPEKDLTIIQNIDFGSTAPAFADGRGDFTIEFEPGATSLESEGKGHVIASLGKDSGYVPYTAFSAKKSYLKENPDVIQRFTNALQKGMDYVRHSLVKDAVIVSLELDADTITAHCRHCVYSVIWQQLSGIVHKEQRNEPNLHTAADLRKGRFQSVCT